MAAWALVALLTTIGSVVANRSSASIFDVFKRAALVGSSVPSIVVVLMAIVGEVGPLAVIAWSFMTVLMIPTAAIVGGATMTWCRGVEPSGWARLGDLLEREDRRGSVADHAVGFPRSTKSRAR